MFMEIGLGAAALYSVLEIGAYLDETRKFDLPKEYEDEPRVTYHGSYFDVIFRDACTQCTDAQEREYRHLRASPNGAYIKHDIHVVCNCPGHQIPIPADVYKEPTTRLGWLARGIDYFINGHPDDRPDTDYKEGGSEYSLEDFSHKVRTVASNIVHEYREAKEEAEAVAKYAKEHPKTVRKDGIYMDGLEELFSDDESD